MQVITGKFNNLKTKATFLRGKQFKLCSVVLEGKRERERINERLNTFNYAGINLN